MLHVIDRKQHMCTPRPASAIGTSAMQCGGNVAIVNDQYAFRRDLDDVALPRWFYGIRVSCQFQPTCNTSDQYITCDLVVTQPHMCQLASYRGDLRVKQHFNTILSCLTLSCTSWDLVTPRHFVSQEGLLSV